MPLSPYIDDDLALAPRYADRDMTSAPPSPASIQSFDILEAIPWRKSYISLDADTEHNYQKRSSADPRNHAPAHPFHDRTFSGHHSSSALLQQATAVNMPITLRR
jgi:hypothetical protein